MPTKHVFTRVPITKSIDLGEYDPVYAGREVRVLVNLSKALRVERLRLLAEFARLAQGGGWLTRQYQRVELYFTQRDWFRWLADVWSHGAEDTHWTVDEVRTLYQVEPTLYHWLVKRTTELVDGFAEDKKKA